MDNETIRRVNAGTRDLEAQLLEARELLLHFRFIAHGPGCICAMCEKRAAWLARFPPETTGK
jgi:hypothetical protein